MTVAPVRASGVGSWPSVGSRDAVRTVRDLLAAAGSDGMGVPYLPEQPTRGPGADMIGRSAGMLVEMSADLQPSGWRLAPGSGRDVRRAESYLGEDLDEVAEAYEGYDGSFKVQLVGPWTLAARLWLPRGERVVSDLGAVRDVAQSLAAGALDHLERVQRLLPAADIVVQIDEPSLPGVLRGEVVDFFSLPHFAIFNVADICITLTALLLLAVSLVHRDAPAAPVVGDAGTDRDVRSVDGADADADEVSR